MFPSVRAAVSTFLPEDSELRVSAEITFFFSPLFLNLFFISVSLLSPGRSVISIKAKFSVSKPAG